MIIEFYFNLFCYYDNNHLVTPINLQINANTSRKITNRKFY